MTELTDQNGTFHGTLNNFALSGITSNWIESYAMVVPTAKAASNVSVSGFTANWAVPETGNIDNYLLEVASDNGFNQPVTGSPFNVVSSATSSLVSGLLPMTNYYYRVRAHKSSVTGQGAWSVIETVTTSPASTIFQTAGNWSVASNWSNGMPGVGTDVTIAAACIEDGNYTAGSAIINSNATLTVGSGKTLTVGGNLTLKSDVGNTASLINNGTLNVAGKTIVQRFMTKDAWHMIGSPVTGQSIGSFLTANTTIAANPSVPTNKAMKDYDEAGNKWNGLTYYTTTTADMLANKGYAVWPASNGVVSFEGALQSGNKEVSVVKEGFGWNCIGNPYTSAIAINSAASATNNFININLSGSSKFASSYEAIYVWNQAAGSYDIVNHSYSEGAYYIPVGQAFFVRTAAEGTFSFTPEMQSHQTGASFKSAAVEWPTISIKATANSKSSTAVVKFNPDMSCGLDVGYDAGAMKTGFDIYTRLVDDNGVDFGIQCLPLDEVDRYTISVGIKSSEKTKVNLLIETSNLPSGCAVAFEDRERETTVPISKSAQNIVVEVPAKSTLANRFYLQISNPNSTTGMGNWGNKLIITSGKGQINILGVEASNATATLYDVQGRKMCSAKLNRGQINSTSTLGLLNGIYLLKVNQMGGSVTKKLSVKN